MKKDPLYRVVFQSEGQVYEIYAKSVSQGSLFGFVEIGELVFGERSSVVVDPGEERLKAKFADVRAFHVPIHAVLRIDEVLKPGTAKITPQDGEGSKVTPFPIYTSTGKPES